MICFPIVIRYLWDNAIKRRHDEYREDVIVPALCGWVLIHLRRRKRFQLSLSMDDADSNGE